MGGSGRRAGATSSSARSSAAVGVGDGVSRHVLPGQPRLHDTVDEQPATMAESTNDEVMLNQ